MEQEDVKISGEFHEVYDAAVKLWADLDIAIRGSAEDNGVSSDVEAAPVQSLLDVVCLQYPSVLLLVGVGCCACPWIWLEAES